MPRIGQLHDLYQNPDGSLTVKLVDPEGNVETFEALLDEEQMRNPKPDYEPSLIVPVRFVPLTHPGARRFGWTRNLN